MIKFGRCSNFSSITSLLTSPEYLRFDMDLKKCDLIQIHCLFQQIGPEKNSTPERSLIIGIGMVSFSLFNFCHSVLSCEISLNLLETCPQDLRVIESKQEKMVSTTSSGNNPKIAILKLAYILRHVEHNFWNLEVERK